MGDGGGASTKYTQSPESKQIMQAIMPMIQGMGQYGAQRYFGNQGGGSPGQSPFAQQGQRMGGGMGSVGGGVNASAPAEGVTTRAPAYARDAVLPAGARGVTVAAVAPVA